jgi:hypothetical protein
MYKIKKTHAITAFIFVFLVSISTFIYAQPQEDVTVTSSVQACLLDIIARPEQRVPAINNWDSVVDFNILTMADAPLASFTLPTNIQGLATYDFCANSIFPVQGNYKFYARALSHLRKRFTPISAFNTYYDTINLTGASNFLIAGEVSNVFDNKINSLDIAYINGMMGSSDVKADLNQDGIVDGLDVTIARNNIFKIGDTLP